MKFKGATLGCWVRTMAYVPPYRLLYKLWRRMKGVFYASPFYRLKDEMIGLGKDILEPLTEVPHLWLGDAERGREIVDGRWRFIGQTLPRGKAVDWTPGKASLLWQFHLHYHDWLADLRVVNDKKLAQQLVGEWMRECGHYHPVAWHPYPLSLRIVNWLVHAEWLLKGWEASEQLAFREVLVQQVRFLEHNLEWDLGYNHLLKNLKALVFAGVAVPGCEDLLVPGLAQFMREVQGQMLEDGGHAERSPSYLRQVLQDVVDVSALLRPRGGAPLPLKEAMEKMATVLAALRYPDGGLALFNDGEVEDSAEVERVLRHAWNGDEVTLLPESGYARMVRGKTVVLIDFGKVGPDDNPGHAHADTLSFEMCVGEERVLVNGGTLGYQTAERTMMRGTRMHNTVMVENQDSSEVWGGFRVGRRVRQVGFAAKGFDKDKGEIVFEGWHDGYRHLGVVHRRKVVLAGDGRMLKGEDEVIDKKAKKRRCEAGFLVHPRVAVEAVDESKVWLTTAAGVVLEFAVEGGRLGIKDGFYCPFFGQKLPTKRLVVQGSSGPGGRWQLRWSLRRIKGESGADEG